MKEITEWEILTPQGWKDFQGIIELEKETIKIILNSNEFLIGSKTHIVYNEDNEPVMLEDVKVGDKIQTKDGLKIIIKIEEGGIRKVYDIVEIDTEEHQYYTNDIVSKNCDELAFVPARIQDEFIASIGPALSSSEGKLLITSTPQGTKDLFAKLWFNSGMKWIEKDKTYKRIQKNIKNDYVPLFIPYWIDPEKNTEEWIKKQKGTINDEIKWKVEFECLSAETKVEVFDKVDNTYKQLTLKEIAELLEN